MEQLRLLFLYLYLFSLSIENWSPWGGATDLLRPALIFGIMYVALSTFQLNKNFNLIYTKKLVLPAFMLWFFMTATSIVYVTIHPQAKFTLNYTLLSCIISFWLISNDLHRYAYLKNHFLMIILLNGIFLSIISYFQIGVDVGHMERQSLLGNNPNVIGFSAVISLLIIVVIVIDNPMNFPKLRLLLLVTVPLLLQAMARTGSKGAILLLFTGFALYFILLNKPIKYKIPIFIIGVLASLIIYGYLLQNEVLAARWGDFIETGDTTGRAVRWLFAFQTFLDNPLFGVGENGYEYIPSPFRGSNEPHNVYLYVLATGGITAFIPFSLFLMRLIKKAYKKKSIWNSPFPFILLIILLMYWFKAGGGINSKLAWAYFSLISYNEQRKHYDKISTNENSNTRIET